MAKQVQQRDKSEAIGMFVYHTDKYKNVYYDVLTKKSYVIFNSEVGRFNVYNATGLLALLVGFACYYYLKINAIISVIVGLGIYVLGHVLFRINVVSKLTEIKDFKRPSRNYIDTISNNYSLVKLSLMNLLLVVFVVLCYLNINNEQYTGSNLVLNYGLMAAAGVLLVIYLLALFKKLSSNK